jgi:hypothetical protein
MNHDKVTIPLTDLAGVPGRILIGPVGSGLRPTIERDRRKAQEEGYEVVEVKNGDEPALLLKKDGQNDILITY